MAKYEGYCELCGHYAGKIAIKNHIIKKHNEGKYKCYLIRAESVWKGSPYWLLFSAPKTSLLDEVDDLLREIWCECCGHLSGFFQGRYDEIEMDERLTYFRVGDTFRYDYDFGSTTSLKLTIVDEMLSDKKKPQLLGRNKMPEHKCTSCGDEADYIDYDWSSEDFACEKCYSKDENEDFNWLPTANSPRMGICGYVGEGTGISLKPIGNHEEPTNLINLMQDQDLMLDSDDYDDFEFYEDEAFLEFTKLVKDELGLDLMSMSPAEISEFQRAFIELVGFPSLEDLREADEVEMFLDSCVEMEPMYEEEMQQLIAFGGQDELADYGKYISHTVEILNGLTPEEANGYDFSEIYASYELLRLYLNSFAKEDGRS